jgi:3-oxoacyl-[acyl-carrier-protein] synthase II
VKSRVGITGIGVVSAIGNGFNAFADAALKSVNGISEISVFDTSNYINKLAGEIKDFDAGHYLPKKILRKMDRSTGFICSAAAMAVEDAKLQIDDSNKHRVGVIIGTTFGNLKSISDFDVQSLMEESPLWVNPADFPKTTINAAASHISILTGAMGYNTTLVGGFVTMLETINHGVELLESGKLDIILAGCVEDLNEQSYLHYSSRGILSGSNGGNEKGAPFDKSANGCIIAEGAVVLVLQRLEELQQHDGPMYGEIKRVYQEYAGCSNTSYYAKPMVGRYASILKTSIELANLSLDEIDVISASANGWKEYDLIEASAYYELFGENSPAIISAKSSLGEANSVGGAFSILFAIASIMKQQVPYIADLKAPIVPLNYVVEKAHKCEVKNILVPSFDPYGNCMGMIIGV